MDEIKQRFDLLTPFLTENLRRRVAAAEAMAIGYGGISIVARETGVSRGAIALGCEELKNPEKVDETRIRRKGGGRKQAIVKDPTLKDDIEKLIEPVASGRYDTPPLCWTCKSVRTLATELTRMNHKISHNRVADLLHELGYSLQANQKTLEGASYAERSMQFGYIAKKVQAFQTLAQPVIFVEIRKKELITKANGNSRPIGAAHTESLPDSALIFAEQAGTPSIDDTAHSAGWLSVDIDRDTIVFAVNGIRQWWYSMGKTTFPATQQLLIIVDSGSSNEEQIALWKNELHKLVNELTLIMNVCHMPPGTSRWRCIEHCQLSFNTHSQHGKPLVNHRVTVSQIGITTAQEKTISTSASTSAITDMPLQGWNYSISSDS